MNKPNEAAEAVAEVESDLSDTAEVIGEDIADAAAAIEEDIATAVPEIEEQLRAEVEHWKDYARRAQAEFANTRKRLEARASDELQRAGSRMVTSLAPVIDDIELAMAHADETGNDLKDGLSAIHTKFLSALEREGVEVIDPTGQPFDSEVAQAVSVVDDADAEPNTVVSVLQKGYRMGGKTLRPAMVVVSKAG